MTLEPSPWLHGEGKMCSFNITTYFNHVALATFFSCSGWGQNPGRATNLDLRNINITQWIQSIITFSTGRKKNQEARSPKISGISKGCSRHNYLPFLVGLSALGFLGVCYTLGSKG